MPGSKLFYTPRVTAEEFRRGVEKSIDRKVETVVFINTTWEEWEKSKIASGRSAQITE